MKRCDWPGDDERMQQYHDREWGVPLHDDRKLFEFLVLDAFQAGLSWRTVLHKREGFENAFAGFDYERVARFTEDDVRRLKGDTAIIRNEQKIRCTISNAQRLLEVQQEAGSFDEYIWSFVDGRPLVNEWRRLDEIPATSAESKAMSRDLKKRGFKFVGPTICYAFMQAAGLVNDHLIRCFRYTEINAR